MMRKFVWFLAMALILCGVSAGVVGQTAEAPFKAEPPPIPEGLQYPTQAMSASIKQLEAPVPLTQEKINEEKAKTRAVVQPLYDSVLAGLRAAGRECQIVPVGTKIYAKGCGPNAHNVGPKIPYGAKNSRWCQVCASGGFGEFAGPIHDDGWAIIHASPDCADRGAPGH